jgi:hypothetical protein
MWAEQIKSYNGNVLYCMKYVIILFDNTKICGIWKNVPNACSVSTLNGKGNLLEKEFLKKYVGTFYITLYFV